jgi:hypothetical protein
MRGADKEDRAAAADRAAYLLYRTLPAVEGGDVPRRVRSDYREGAQADAAMMNGARRAHGTRSW